MLYTLWLSILFHESLAFSIIIVSNTIAETVMVHKTCENDKEWKTIWIQIDLIHSKWFNIIRKMLISWLRNGNVPFDLIEIFYAMKVWYFLS